MQERNPTCVSGFNDPVIPTHRVITLSLFLPCDGQLVLLEHGQNVSMPCRLAHSAIRRMVSVHGRTSPDNVSAWSAFTRDS